MDEIQLRLIRCFAAVFPEVPEAQIPTLTQESTAGWESVATVTLFALIEEEFGIGLDLDALENLESFQRIYAYLCSRTRP